MGGCINQNDSDWKNLIYKGTNLGHNMLCESVKYDKEEKEGDLLNSNRSIDLNSFITNIDHFLVCKEFEQYMYLQIKWKEGK